MLPTCLPLPQILDTPCDDAASPSSPGSPGNTELRGALLEALISKNLTHPCIVQTYAFAVHTTEASWSGGWAVLWIGGWAAL